MEGKFTKLSELVDSDFTIEKVWGFTFKMWDNEQKKMLTSDTWQKGFRKVFQVDTDKGKLDLSESQLGSIFAGVQHAGKSDIIGVVVNVKSNGKTGIDIRYYLNPQRKVESEDLPPEWS